MLSVILPVKDPEPYLPYLVDEIQELLVNAGIQREILIQKEPGLTNAIVEGVKRSTFPFIAVMDADGSHEPFALLAMYAVLYPKQHDLVIGYKDVDETSWIRQVISKIYRILAKALLGTRIHDPMSGYVMGTREIFQTLQPSMDYKFLLQLLAKNPKISEIPIIFHQRKAGKSKATLLTGFRTLYSMVKIGLQRRMVL